MQCLLELAKEAKEADQIAEIGSGDGEVDYAFD